MLPYSCSKCEGNTTSFKIFGMPAVERLEELKSLGVDVEIMGCMPPLANKKTYVFKCKNCKHKWLEYREYQENYFQFTLNTYPGQYMGTIVYQEGLISLEHNDYSEYIRIPNRNETDIFWKNIDELDVWSWDKDYTNDQVLDGFDWELTIKKIEQKEKKIYGYNNYPKDKKFFNSFLKCMKDFTSWDFEI